MNKLMKARKHNSSSLQDLLDEITPLEMEQTKNKMQLAARIEDLMKAKGWSKSQLAKEMGKNPSEVTKWLSGTQNFTIDVLTEIASTLGVTLTTIFEKNQTQVISKNEIILTSVFPKMKKRTNPFVVQEPELSYHLSGPWSNSTKSSNHSPKFLA